MCYKTSLVFLISFFFIFEAKVFCATPTMEGLFRNGDNKEVASGFTVLKFYVNEVVDEEKLKTTIVTAESGELDKAVKSEQSKPRYFKCVFSLERDNKVQFLQVEYTSPEMQPETLVGVKYIPDLIKDLDSVEKPSRQLFYAFLNMFVLNDSRAISNQMEKYDSGFQKNKLAMNSDKKGLLLRQKEYLAAIKGDAKAKESLKSPLEGSSEDEKTKLTEINNQEMYQKSDKIKLERVGRKFMWNLKLDNVSGYFGNIDHRLQNITIKKYDAEFRLSCGNYVLLDGIHNFPEMLRIQDFDGGSYEVYMTYLSYFANSGSSVGTRYKEYLDQLAKIKKSTKDVVPKTAESLLY